MRLAQGLLEGRGQTELKANHRRILLLALETQVRQPSDYPSQICKKAVLEFTENCDVPKFDFQMLGCWEVYQNQDDLLSRS